MLEFAKFSVKGLATQFKNSRLFNILSTNLVYFLKMEC